MTNRFKTAAKAPYFDMIQVKAPRMLVMKEKTGHSD
jgi:hypothetical protein